MWQVETSCKFNQIDFHTNSTAGRKTTMSACAAMRCDTSKTSDCKTCGNRYALKKKIRDYLGIFPI